MVEKENGRMTLHLSGVQALNSRWSKVTESNGDHVE